MMAVGMDFFATANMPLGKYTKASKRLIPPKREDGAMVRVYIEDLQRAYRRLEAENIKHVPMIDYDKLVQNVYRSFATNLRKIPKTQKKRREEFMDRAFGMCLHEYGGISTKSFTAEKPPEYMELKQVGRPKSKRDNEEEAT